MDSKLFGFITASFSTLFWTSLPSTYVIIALAISACLLIRKYNTTAFILLGIVWMASVGHWQYSLQLPSELITKPFQVKGKVASLVHTQNNIRFNLKVHHIEGESLVTPRMIRLSWRDASWLVQQGQSVNLMVKVKPNHGLANQGGFRYQQWLFSEGIVATGYVKRSQKNNLLINSVSIRQFLLNQLLMMELEHQRWIAAITFGYRGLLEPNDWQLVQVTGIAHLIAISGLHLALVASMSYGAFAWGLGSLVSRFDKFHKVNMHNTTVILTLIATFLYSGLAGFGLPTLRAWIMLMLFSLYFLWSKNVRPLSLLLLSLLCFILVFPLSIFGLSFWLSFSAVMIIAFVFWRWPMKSKGFSFRAAISSMVRVQLALTLLMLPIVAWQFSYVSIVSPLVNLVAVPIVTMVLVPLCLFAVLLIWVSVEGASWIFHLVDYLIDFGIRGLSLTNETDWAFFNISAFHPIVWAAAFFAVVLCFLPKLWLTRKWAYVFALPLLTHIPASRSDNWQIHVLDVGQGLSVLIEKNNRGLLYDVGAAYPSGFNMADSVIAPFLQAKGISALDTVFISHDDNDHAGSLLQLKKAISIERILTNQNLCIQGLDIEWQGLNVIAMWPDDGVNYNDNDGSCVIKVTDKYHSVLLPGDISRKIENILVSQYPEQLRSDILLAPHHGSNTSSSYGFINAVEADYVIFSQGFMNRWKFPKEKVLERYKNGNNKNTKLFSTSETGQVSFSIPFKSPKAIKVLTFRQSMFPYWYANH